MPHGNIIRIEAGPGFGFIRDDGGMDWFFVAAAVRGGRFDNIWVGERVGFTPEMRKKAAATRRAKAAKRQARRQRKAVA